MSISAADVLTVMRDHTGIAGVSGGKVCLCREVFFTPIEHTAHVAEAIAEAVRLDARARRIRGLAAAVPDQTGRRRVPAGELGLEHLGARVVAPVDSLGRDVSGLLLRAELGSDP